MTGFLAADVDANFLHHLNRDRVNLRSRSGSGTDCAVAFWRILSVEEPFSHLAPAGILNTYKQNYLFLLLLVFLLTAEKTGLPSAIASLPL
jgi:hypothetical protein